MNLPAHCIRRPVMTSLLTAALCVFGAMAYKFLPVSDLPNIDFPTIVVTANLPGATPETMASAVATPLEQQFSTIAGIDSMTSTSSLGATAITLQFTLERSIDAAAQDVQSALAAVQRRLPNDMPSPPSFRKTNPADTPILFMSVVSPSLPLSVVARVCRDAAGAADLHGRWRRAGAGLRAQKYALRVQLDPRALASRGITLDEVRAALSTHNVNLPTGILDGDRQTMTWLHPASSPTAPTSARWWSPIATVRRCGSVTGPGHRQRAGEPRRILVLQWHHGTRAIGLGVQRQPGTNTIEVVSRIRALLPSLRQQLPASVKLEILMDKSISCASRSTMCSSRSCCRSRSSSWSSSSSCGR